MKIAEALTKSMVINEILKVGEEVIEKYKLFELKEYLLSVRNLNRAIKILRISKINRSFRRT